MYLSCIGFKAWCDRYLQYVVQEPEHGHGRRYGTQAYE